MSTRTTLAIATVDDVLLHVYREMHDGCAHLELSLDHTNIVLNLVIPDPMVPGLAEAIAIVERDGETRGEIVP